MLVNLKLPVENEWLAAGILSFVNIFLNRKMQLSLLHHMSVIFLYFFRVYTWMYLHPGDTLEIAAATHWPCFEQLEEYQNYEPVVLPWAQSQKGDVPNYGQSKKYDQHQFLILKSWGAPICGYLFMVYWYTNKMYIQRVYIYII